MRLLIALALCLCAVPLFAEDKPPLPYPWDPGWDYATNMADIEALPESTLHLSLNNATDEMLAALKRFPGLQSLSTTGTFGNNGVKHLEKLETLRDLQIGCKSLTDVAMTSIAKLRELEWLGLEECNRIGNRGLADVAGLKKLTWLIIHGQTQGGFDAQPNQELTDAGIKALSGLSAMERLDISGCTKLRGDGLADCIPKMKALKFLTLHDCESLGDDALLSLAKHPAITELDFTSLDGFTAKGWKALESMKALEKVSLSMTPIDLKSVEHLSKSKALKKLTVSGPGVIGDEALALLADCKSLNELSITVWDMGEMPSFPGAEPEKTAPAAVITNKGLKALGRSKSITQLYLIGLGDISDAGISSLVTMPLISLGLQGCSAISDAALEHVVKIATLRRLQLGTQTMGPPGTAGDPGPRITDKGLAVLQALPALTELDLSGQRKITDKGLEALSAIPTLINLTLSMSDYAMPGAPAPASSPITDAGVAHLAKLQHLERLDMSGTKLTDQGLRHLHAVKSLKELSIVGCESVTDAAVGELQSAVPACSVMHRVPDFPG